MNGDGLFWAMFTTEKAMSCWQHWSGLTIQGYFFPAQKEKDIFKVTQSMMPTLSLITLIQLHLYAWELLDIVLHPHPLLLFPAATK